LNEIAKESAQWLRLAPKWVTPSAVLTAVLVTALLLLWRASAVEQMRLVAKVTKGAGDSLLSRLRELNRGVGLLTDGTAPLIQQLFANPADEQLEASLRRRIERAFPESFAFTLAD